MDIQQQEQQKRHSFNSPLSCTNQVLGEPVTER